MIGSKVASIGVEANGGRPNEGWTANPAAGLPEARWLLASGPMADILDEHDFGLRERLVLSLIRKLSFGAGKPMAEIPRLESFGVALRVSRGNVGVVIKELVRKQVIEVQDGFYYGFRFPIGFWKVPRRMEEIEVITQLTLFERPADLLTVLRETFVEQLQAAAAHTQTHTDTYTQAQQVRALNTHAGAITPALRSTSVPDSGTGASLHAYPIRVRSKTANIYGPEPGQAGAGPESGTDRRVPVGTGGTVPVANLQHCKNVPSGSSLKEALKQIYNVACTQSMPGGVPDSGTAVSGHGGDQGSGRLDEDRQRIFDELATAGAFGARLESRGCWFGMVRARPAVVEQLLGDLRYAIKCRPQDVIRSPGAWMMDRWQRWGRPDR